MQYQGLTDGQLRERTLQFAARLRIFHADASDARSAVLDKTLPGWSAEARASGFQRATQSLQAQHSETQRGFKEAFEAEALGLERELMARLGIAVRRDGVHLTPLQSDAAEYLEELARRLPPKGDSPLEQAT